MSFPDVAPPHDCPLPEANRRKAAWWSWPLVVFALLPFNWFFEKAGEGASPAGGEIAVSGSADLALLKLQSQVVIASSKLDPGASEEALESLSTGIEGDRAIASLALLEAFVAPDSPRASETLGRFSKGVSRDLEESARLAVREGIDEAGRDRLRVHVGWFADLARGPELSPPPREGSIRAKSFLALTVLGLVVTAAVVGILGGAVLLVLHWRHVRLGRNANAFDPESGRTGVFLECFALYLGIMTLGSLVGGFLNVWGGIGCSILAVAFPLVWPRMRGLTWGEFRTSVGLHQGRGWGREIGAGVIGYLGVLAIASIGIALTLALTLVADFMDAPGSAGGGNPGSSGPEVHPVFGWLYEGSFWERFACLVLAAGFAPFFEELFFRGALYRHLRGRFRFLASALISSVIFAALHPQGYFAIPALAGIGVGFSLLREWRDSLVAPMVAHAINNGCLVGMFWILL